MMDNDYKLSLQIIGPTLPPEQDLLQLLGMPLASLRRQVSTRDGGSQDVCVTEIAPRLPQADLPASFQKATQALRSMSPGLQQLLQQVGVKGSFYISTIRATEMGGFDLPSDFIAAISQAGLGLTVSIMVIFPDEEEGDETAHEEAHETHDEEAGNNSDAIQ